MTFWLLRLLWDWVLRRFHYSDDDGFSWLDDLAPIRRTTLPDPDLEEDMCAGVPPFF